LGISVSSFSAGATRRSEKPPLPTTLSRVSGPRVPGLREPVDVEPGRADVVVAARAPVGELVAEDERIELVDEDELVRGEGLVEGGRDE
jgi:hypothetical protein